MNIGLIIAIIIIAIVIIWLISGYNNFVALKNRGKRSFCYNGCLFKEKMGFNS